MVIKISLKKATATLDKALYTINENRKKLKNI